MKGAVLDLRIPGTGDAVPEGGCGKDPRWGSGYGENGTSRLTVPAGTPDAGAHPHPLSVHRRRVRRWRFRHQRPAPEMPARPSPAPH